jgi:two-component system sporulation sensor kinase B
MIISDYLSLAKPDPEQIEPIHIRDELTYIANLLQSYANIQSVQIATIFISDKPFYIMGDKFKFRQALLNIGKNAIEAMHGGGLLKLEAAEVPNKVVISVADTGIGMTEEQINRLGTPYYSTKDKGTGLGTMVSFSIIKKMGGTITIKSEPGKGTVYHISFPLHQ